MDEEVERLRDKRTGQLDFIRGHGITATKLSEKLIPILIESSERRNLLVHHNGRVTYQYRSNLMKYGIEPAKQGAVLTVTDKYLERAASCVASVAIQTSMNLLRPSHRERLGELILRDIFGSLLTNNEHNIVVALSNSIETAGKLSPNLRNTLYINKALAYKELDEPARMKAELRYISRQKTIYVKLAQSCLLNEHDKAISLLDSVKTKGQLKQIDAQMRDPENPVFRSLVLTPEYAKYARERLDDALPKVIKLGE